MARTCVAASSQYLWATAAPAVTLPITIACWVRPTASGLVTTQMLATETEAGVNKGLYLWLNNAGKGVCQTYDGTVNILATGATPFAAGVWAHLCGTLSPTTFQIFKDGVADGSVAGGVASIAPTITQVGRASSAAPFFFDGDLAEIAFWNVILTGPEIAALAAGGLANVVRPAGLMAYYRILGTNAPEPDSQGGPALTVVGATPAAHPPLVPVSGIPPGAGRMFQVF